ncbi:MAG: 5-oxoprolinase subunit PxpB [Chloroflexota bacterium]|nr:5-oxoprolinase subunit PxpB [Chloroflexota bacterium]
MIRPFGEAALLVELNGPEEAQALAASFRAQPARGVLDAVPGLASVLVDIDPLSADPDRVTSEIERRIAGLDPTPSVGALHTIPVVYDGSDLDEVAALIGLQPSEVIELHASTELRVLFCGFAPGFAYLGDLPTELHVPRLARPRTRTPAGSVAIAGSMSGIYPADLPGGWRIIGRTDVSLFDARRDPPTLMLPGDRVRFEPA